MIARFSDLDGYAKDVLGELGNIGTGNAVTALSQMLNRPIQMECPAVRILDFNQVSEYLGGIEELRVGVMLGIDGDLRGIFMFLLSEPFLKTMFAELLDTEITSICNMDEMAESAVSEIGNIMCCSYINALTKMMDVKVQVSVPDICVDMIGSLLSVPMIHFASLNDELLLIENRYHFGDLSMTSHILFLPEIDSLKRIFLALGEDYEQ